MSKKTNREVRNELRWARSFTGSERDTSKKLKETHQGPTNIHGNEEKPIGNGACISKKKNREARNESRWAKRFTGSERHKQEIKETAAGT